MRSITIVGCEIRERLMLLDKNSRPSRRYPLHNPEYGTTACRVDIVHVLRNDGGSCTQSMTLGPAVRSWPVEKTPLS